MSVELPDELGKMAYEAHRTPANPYDLVRAAYERGLKDERERCAKTIKEYADQEQSLADESEAAGGMRTPYLWGMDAALAILDKIRGSKLKGSADV